MFNKKKYKTYYTLECVQKNFFLNKLNRFALRYIFKTEAEATPKKIGCIKFPNLLSTLLLVSFKILQTIFKRIINFDSTTSNDIRVLFEYINDFLN